VLVAGAPATKASRLVAPDEPLFVAGPAPRFVGRGGEKLAAALDRFDVDLGGTTVLDAGASTGGFTDCALQAGAARVIAVDVGRGQLHQRLRTDPRVDVHERTNVRHLEPSALGGPVDAIVADLSFISLRTVAPALLALVRPGGDLVWLVKPQFEAGKAEAARGKGVIADPDVWSRVLGEVLVTLDTLGAANMGLMRSPLRGADGNVEFLLHARAPGSGAPGRPVAELVAGAMHEAVPVAEDEAEADTTAEPGEML
jgi:23S rRNA (cytidine1920-2'-O)/16S rRNA (cytidine1409-2'-O)-methyltransferase